MERPGSRFGTQEPSRDAILRLRDGGWFLIPGASICLTHGADELTEVDDIRRIKEVRSGAE
jgi:hypothetical protein